MQLIVILMVLLFFKKFRVFDPLGIFGKGHDGSYVGGPEERQKN
jgi:hypothetical protein